MQQARDHVRPLRIVYCVGGVRSGLAWAWLTDHGYDVANYDGSWWEWARETPAE
ncbi:MAG: rhodanese-like domain-containing protein [Pseudomonadota bacterium]|nr:rhodanese-like domain-containing protein [Pseudomonadota bacterium]